MPRCAAQRFAALCLTLWLGAAPVAVGAGIEVTIAGVEGDLRDNVVAFIDDRVDLDSPLAARLHRTRVEEQVREALEALGHYQADIAISLEERDGQWHLDLEIDPGPRVTLRMVNVVIRGDGADDGAFERLRERLPIASGDGLDHGRYEASKRALRSLARERGYFDHEFATARLAVHGEEGWADAELVFDTGSRYVFGPVKFSDSPFREAFLERLVPFESGMPYDAGEVSTFNTRLLESGYFEDARVDVAADEPDNRQIPVNAEVETRQRNTVSTGVGYSTDEGPRLRLGFTRHYVNDRGHRLTAESRFSEVRQALDARYEIPLSDPLRDNLTVSTGWENEEVDDLRSERYSLGVSRRQQFNSGWVRTQSVRLLDERFSVGAESGRSQLFLPGLSFSRTRSRGEPDPHWGDRQDYSLEAGAREILSDVDIARLRVGHTWLRTAGEGHRFQLRGDLGGIATNEFSDVPTSLRFFAGGDQSLRGFAFRSLGPTDDDGDVVGGRYLATGSAEYSYPVVGGWRMAAFVDAGNAFDQLDEVDPEVGVGFGVRWRSPVGPLRIDLAWGVSRDDNPLRLHLSVGPPF